MRNSNCYVPRPFLHPGCQVCPLPARLSVGTVCLLPQVSQRQRAWDCATGNGQVAWALAESFAEVAATDLSPHQLAHARQRANVHYQAAPAEHTPFPNQYFDLITVAQAVHWFDGPAYHREVHRVARPGAVLAEWGYNLVQTSEEALNSLVREFHDRTLRPYWDANRWHVIDEYSRLPFPFADVQQAAFQVRRQWSADWFLGYLRTWSAVQNYQKVHQQDPILLLADRLTQLWGKGERELWFPVFARSGQAE